MAISLPAHGGQLPVDSTNYPPQEASSPRFLIIGAGARGNAYARAVTESTNGRIVAVAEPIAHKRQALGQRYIWGTADPKDGQAFEDWRAFVRHEQTRRSCAGRLDHKVPAGVDGVFVCVLDEAHAEVVVGLRELNLHIMCEKPLATRLDDCLKIYWSLKPSNSECLRNVFSIGHVLRYSPHNMLLRELLLEDDVIGDILSIEHTEPVGWWHFSHSYVRGNWRKEATTAPSLLTKSCHDIDFLLWMLCSPPPSSCKPPHLPSYLASTGSLSYFKPSRKPALAGKATNCLSCVAEPECIYSAKKIYQDTHLSRGNAGWPVHIVDPEIEDCLQTKGQVAAEAKLMEHLAEDYNASTPQDKIDRRPWFGRCVYESDNDVCDDQVVTITWEDDPLPTSLDSASDMISGLKGRGAKTATFHMIAFTEAQCERRGRIYGSKGEISYNSKEIRVYDFATKKAQIHHPHQSGGGHGGGDDGLARQFVRAVDAVKNRGMTVEEAQQIYVGCALDEIIRSHAMVFAAEEARRGRKVVDWKEWCERNHVTCL